MAEVMLALGGYRFSVDTAAYQTLRRVNEYRWPAQDRIGREPARQYVGPGNQTVELDGIIYPHYRGGLGQLDTMRTEAGKGAPLMLVASADARKGTVLGRWVIERIEETQSAHLPGGAPRKVAFRLALAYYGEDGA